MQHGKELPLVQVPTFVALQLGELLTFTLVLLQLAVQLEVLMMLTVLFAHGLDGVVNVVVGQSLLKVREDEIVWGAAE